MKKEDLIKQLEKLAPETQDMLIEMLIDIKHSKDGPLGNSRIVDLEPQSELNLFGGTTNQAKEYLDYIVQSQCDQIILNAVLKYHLVKMGANISLPGKETIDAVCAYGYSLTVPQIHAVIFGLTPEKAKETIAGSIFDIDNDNSLSVEMDRSDRKDLTVNMTPEIKTYSTPTTEPLNNELNNISK